LQLASTVHHWKYIIAHEVGHNAQWRTMGNWNYNYDDSARATLGADAAPDFRRPEEVKSIRPYSGTPAFQTTFF
jgi:hypothetical protein